MKQRILTGSLIAVVLILAFISRILTLYIFDIIIGVIIILAALEFSKILSRTGLYNYMTLVGLFPSMLYLVIMLGVIYKLELGFVLLLEFALIALFVILTFIISLFFKKYLELEIKTKNLKDKWGFFALKKSLNTALAYIYPSFFLGFIFFLNRFSELTISVNNFQHITSLDFGLFALILAFIIPIVTDTMAMYSGILLKGPKLCPKISPKKTLSGAVGGCAWCVIVVCSLYFVFRQFEEFNTALSSLSLSLTHFALLGFGSSIIAQAGDIFESWLKRKARMKDSGNLLPGHGGFLDRIDSHIFTAPVIFFFFLFVLF